MNSYVAGCKLMETLMLTFHEGGIDSASLVFKSIYL
jgi:hypothetical protein